MSGIIFDSRAEARLSQHFHIKICPLGNALGLNELVLSLEEAHLLLHFLFYIIAGGPDLFLRHHIMGGRKYGNMIQLCMHPAGQRLHLCDPVDLIAEKFHPDKIVSPLGRTHLHHIPMDAKAPSLHIHLVTGILNVHQLPQNLIPVLHHARAQGHHHVLIFVRAAQAVDTGYAGHHHHIPPLRQGDGSRQAKLIDLIVDRGILCYISIRGRHIGLRLVIVIIGHKIFYRIFREKFLELAIELPGQSLIVGYD